MLTYTVGIANLAAVVSNHTYFTYIRTPNGNTIRDRANLQAQLENRVPQDCYSVFCTFTSRRRFLIDTASTGVDWHPIPDTRRWTE